MIKKRRIHLVSGQIVRQFCLFNIPIIEYTKENNRKKWRFCRQKTPRNGQRVAYLKVHRTQPISNDCIQHWLDVFGHMDAFVYFVCDNPVMRDSIYNSPNYFYNQEFAFIKSDRRTLKYYVKELLRGINENPKLWRRITFSQLTPFVHAAKNKYGRTYNIDADDIMILSKPELIADAFKKAEEYADKHNLDCFNFDMFVSKSLGVHWSFGVVYVRNAENVIHMIKRNIYWRHDTCLIEKYKTNYVERFNYNMDWFFTFLRDTKQLKLGTFYIENSSVIHMPDIIIRRNWAFMLHWSQGELILPVIDKLYADKIWAKLPIYKHAVKIDIGLRPDNHLDFMNQFYGTNYWFEHYMADIAHARGIITDSEHKYYKG